MRLCTAAIGIGLALLPGIALAQQRPTADSLVSPHLTPLSIDEPRGFPPAAIIDARPLPTPYQSPSVGGSSSAGHRVQPPVNFRLASAEEAVPRPEAKPPLKLTPRTPANRSSAKGSPKPAATSPTQAIGTIAGSLGIVLGLFLVIAWCSRRFTPAGAAPLPKEAIELLGRAPLAARQQMQLVRIGNKLLLVAISPVGIETLTEITEPTEVEHLVALCRRHQPGSSSAAFRQTLTQLANEPSQAGFVGAPRTTSRGAR